MPNYYSGFFHRVFDKNEAWFRVLPTEERWWKEVIFYYQAVQFVQKGKICDTTSFAIPKVSENHSFSEHQGAS